MRSSLSKLGLALAFLTPAVASAHTFDLASKMPSHLAAVWMVNWFGISTSDPQGSGGDPGYGNWLQTFSKCGISDDPSKCADFPDAGRQRWVASKRRPLAGIYSSSARTEESKRRIDLMLSCVRRPCDLGARLDAFVVQLDSVMFTSAHPQNKQSPTWDLAYRAVTGFLGEADAAQMKGAVWIGNDATVYWHFGSNFGLTTQAQRLGALQADIADTAKLAAAHPSSVSIDGKPFLAFYVDSALMTTAEWTTVLDGARQASGIDFYALATTLNGSYFAAFDALSPWVNLGIWTSATGATLHDQAVSYAKSMHAQISSALAANPGRVMFGGVAPGFDDFTQNWGACQPREMSRDPAVLQGQMDYLTTQNVKGVIIDTWDDWTEGTEIEPDVTDGTSKLVQFKQLLGALYKEPADTAGDQALAQRWLDYGQARSCCFENGPCDAGASKTIDLTCPTALVDASADAAPIVDANVTPMKEAGAEIETAAAGCACDTTTGTTGPALAWLAAMGAVLVRLVRRRKT